MAWIAVVTNAGRGLLDQFAAGGHTLNIDGATVGSGVVAEANLRTQTALTDEEDSASIINAKAVSGGTKYRIQVGPSISAAYTAHQIGIWAKLDNGDSTLLLLAQDSDAGVSVPMKSVSPSFAFGLYLMLAVDNTESLVVNIDESAYVTVGTMNAAIEAALEALKPGNAGFHNSIYRGKNLGSSVTQAQWDAIDAGTFDDLFIGDYWEIDGTTWRIAAFDYWLEDDSYVQSEHHVVIVPDCLFESCKMNATESTAGAYVGSDYYTGNNGNTGKATVQTMIEAAFGSAHILNKQKPLSNRTSDGVASGWSLCNSTFELMNECMVFGSPISGAKMNGYYNYNVGIDNSQLPLFRLDHSKLVVGLAWWLRDVAGTDSFAAVNSTGEAIGMVTDADCDIRPAFAIKA